jgi:hypothetical protein
MRCSWGMLLVVGCVSSLAGHGCGESRKSSPSDATADTSSSVGGAASGGVSGTGGGQAGMSGEVGVGGTGGVGSVAAAGGAGGVGPMDVVSSTGGFGGVGAIDAVGVDALIAQDPEVGSDAARFTCGGRTCVVGEAYCRATQGGVGGAPGAGGASGAGGSSGGPPGSCTSFPVDCTTRLDCTCLCGSPTCRTMTSQCDVSDGAVYYTLYNP